MRPTWHWLPFMSNVCQSLDRPRWSVSQYEGICHVTQSFIASSDFMSVIWYVVSTAHGGNNDIRHGSHLQRTYPPDASVIAPSPPPPMGAIFY